MLVVLDALDLKLISLARTFEHSKPYRACGRRTPSRRDIELKMCKFGPLHSARIIAFFSVVSSVGTVVINSYLCLKAHGERVLLYNGEYEKPQVDESRGRFLAVATQSTALITVFALLQFLASVYLLSSDSNKDAVQKGRKWMIITMGLTWLPVVIACAGFTILSKEYIHFDIDINYLYRFYISNLTFIAVHFLASWIFCCRVKNIKNVKYQFIDEEA